MKQKMYLNTLIPLLLISLTLISCSGTEALARQHNNTVSPAAQNTPTPVPPLNSEMSGALETIQQGFNDVYTQVLPSVVNIQVTQTVQQGTLPGTDNLPFSFPFQLPDNGGVFKQSALGSGFVWDTEGHIITNNHVVENADQITVTFYDGTSVDGEVIGTDRDSDLAVVKVDYPADRLQPIQTADSTQVMVGQLVAAIGNPFGLQGTMTVGVISALGRSLPVEDSSSLGSSYVIPDVIQTDAPINPGNSGGVLVDIQGQLLGVPTAIESSSGVNAGIGFVIPSVIVQKVVPELITQGYFEHSWIGISGTTLTSDIAEEMDLSRDQKGILVIDVTPNSPADDAGLVGSDRLATIDDQEIRLGGDVIVQVDSQPVQDFEDLTAYLARYTEAGQTITLTVLRSNGDQDEIDLELGVRPNTDQTISVGEDAQSEEVWLGILGAQMTPEIAEAMNLSSEQSGVLIQQVVENSPADHAGLRGSYKSFTVGGQEILIGGDIITALDETSIADVGSLQAELQKHQPGDEIILSILRDGKTMDLSVTLQTRS